jgi:hypothetical protein
MHDASEVKLKAGKYALSLLVRHTDAGQLESLKKLPLMLRIALSKPSELKVFGDRGSAAAAGHGGAEVVGTGWIRRGGHKNLYVAKPSGKQLPKWAAPGDSMVGHLLVDKKLQPTKIPLVYEIPPAPHGKRVSVKKGGVSDSVADEKKGGEDDDDAAAAAQKDLEALDRAVLDAKLGQLTALRTSSASAERYERLANELLEEHRTHLPLLLELLVWRREAPHPQDGGQGQRNADEEAAEEWRAGMVTDAVEMLMATEGPISAAEVAGYYGVARETDGPDASEEEKEVAKEMDRQRKALRLALFAKAEALCAVEGAWLPVEGSGGTRSSSSTALMDAIKEMKLWVSQPEDLPEEERDGLAITLSRYQRSLGRPGAAVAALRSRLNDQPSASGAKAKRVAEETVRVYSSLGWGHWARNLAEENAEKFPCVKVPL